MSTKHTPGPWTVQRHAKNPQCKERRIAVVGKSGLVADLDWNCTAENEANANLIAAAPGMLAELRSIKAWMQDCMIDKQVKGLPSRERYDAVCAAIAKATGK